MAYFQNQMNPTLYQWLYHTLLSPRATRFPDELARLVLLHLTGDPSPERVNRYGFLLEKPWSPTYVPLASTTGGGAASGAAGTAPTGNLALPPSPSSAAAAAPNGAAGGAPAGFAVSWVPTATLRFQPTPTPLSPILAPTDDSVRLALSRASSAEHYPHRPGASAEPAVSLAAATALATLNGTPLPLPAAGGGAAGPNSAVAHAIANGHHLLAPGAFEQTRSGAGDPLADEARAGPGGDDPERRALARHHAAAALERQQTAERKLRKRIHEWAPFVKLVTAHRTRKAEARAVADASADDDGAPAPSLPPTASDDELIGTDPADQHSLLALAFGVPPASSSSSSPSSSSPSLSSSSSSSSLASSSSHATAKWLDAFVSNRSKLKALVRKGIPNELRSLLWPKLMAAFVHHYNVSHPELLTTAKQTAPPAAAAPVTVSPPHSNSSTHSSSSPPSSPSPTAGAVSVTFVPSSGSLPATTTLMTTTTATPAAEVDVKTSDQQQQSLQPPPKWPPAKAIQRALAKFHGAGAGATTPAGGSSSLSLVALYDELLATPCDADYFIHRSALRTYPDHVFFAEETGRKHLEKLLHAYAVLDPVTGFSAGMSFPAALLVLYVDEPRAFDVFATLFCHPAYGATRDVYAQGLPGLMENLAVLELLMAQHLPELAAHLDREMVSVQFYAVSWFMTQFVADLAFDAVIRVWDVLLSEGPKVLFRVALAILTLVQRDLLRMPCETIMLTLKNCRHLPAQELLHTAFRIRLTSKQIDAARRAYRARKQPSPPRVPPPSS